MIFSGRWRSRLAKMGKHGKTHSLEKIHSHAPLQLLFAVRKRFAILPLPIHLSTAFSRKGRTMDREALRQTLLAKLEEDSGDTFANLNDSVNLRSDLGLDSVDFVQLVIQLQSEYGIMLQTKELENVMLVGDFLDLLEAKLSAKKCAA